LLFRGGVAGRNRPAEEGGESRLHRLKLGRRPPSREEKRLCLTLATHKDLAKKVKEHDRQIATLFSAVEKLLLLPEPKKNPIGYIHPKN